MLSSLQNNRDHRKLIIIDGETVFTGGFNLADEYINAIEKLGTERLWDEAHRKGSMESDAHVFTDVESDM